MKKKQLLAWMLSVVMAVSAIPANMFAVSASETDFVMEETKTVDEDAGYEFPAEVSMQEEDVSFEDVFSAEDELPVDEMLPDAEETFIPEGTDEIETVPVKEEDTAAAEQDSLPEDTALEDVFFDEVFEEGTEEYLQEQLPVQEAEEGPEAELSSSEEAGIEAPEEPELADGFALWEEPAEESLPKAETEAAAEEEEPAEEELTADIEEDTEAEEAAAADLTAPEYTVKFDANGGTWQSDYESYYGVDKTYEEDDYLYTPGRYDVERSGYKLLGWSEVKDGELVVEASDEYTVTKNVILYAKWEKLLTVKYDPNGGTWEEYFEDYGTPKTVENGDEVFVPGEAGALRDGYKLVGWTTVKDSGVPIVAEYYKVTADVTFYAKWEKLLTVKFDPNGGTWTSDYYKEEFGKAKFAENGEDIWLPGNYDIERTGYKMLGWTLTKDTGNVVSSSGRYTVTGDVNFYAKWEKLYAVKYDPNGGTWKADYYKETRYEEKEEEIYFPNEDDLEKKGYVLKGWTLTKDAETILPNSGYAVKADVTFYAKWAKASIVKFDLNGGTWTSEYNKDRYESGVLVETGTTADFPSSYSAKRSGYVLKGWTLRKNKGSAVDETEYKVTKDVTLYAKWAKTYTITFNAGKGYYGTKKSKTHKIEVEGGRAIGSALTDSDYYPINGKQAFAGWYKDAKLKTPAKKSDIIRKNTTYYAKWYTKSYKITVTNLKGASYYNRGTGSYVDSDKSTANSYSYYISQGDSIGYINANKNGRDAFLYFDKGCKEKPYYAGYVPTGNTTVYAKFIDKVTITWDANGGGARNYSDHASSGSITSEKNLMCENLPEVERKGYYFRGWVDTAKPKKILPASHVFTKDTKVQAKWTKAIHITLKANGGNFGNSSNKITKYEFDMKAKIRIGEAKSYISFPYRKGYALTGWKSSVTKKTVKDLYSDKPAKSTVYTAVWKKITSGGSVKVTLMGEAGSISHYVEAERYSTYVAKKVVDVEKNITYKDSSLSISSHDEPSKKLSFAGWSLKKNGKVLDPDYKFTKAVTLYPVWNKQKAPVRVVLVANGGAINKIPSNDPHVYSAAYDNGDFKLPAAKEIEREGYKFIGWYKDYKCTKKIANPTKFKTAKTCYVYAKWKKK